MVAPVVLLKGKFKTGASVVPGTTVITSVAEHPLVFVYVIVVVPRVKPVTSP